VCVCVCVVSNWHVGLYDESARPGGEGAAAKPDAGAHWCKQLGVRV